MNEVRKIYLGELLTFYFLQDVCLFCLFLVYISRLPSLVAALLGLAGRFLLTFKTHLGLEFLA